MDLSSRMLDDARQRSADEGSTNVDFLHADAQVHRFETGSFDVAISVFGAMFFAEPVAAFANIRRSLRPDGRIAFLSWQRFEHNEWLTTLFDALDADMTSISAPIRLGATAAEAWEFVAEMGFVRGLTEGLDDASREESLAELRRRIHAKDTPDGVLLGSAAWLITARQP